MGGGIVATAMTRVKYNNYKRTNDTINNIVNRYVQQNNTVPDGAVAVNMGIDNNGVANGVPARMQPVADGVPVAIMTNNIPLPAEELPVPNPSGLQRV